MADDGKQMDEAIERGLEQGRALQNQPMTGQIVHITIIVSDGFHNVDPPQRFSARREDPAAMTALRSNVAGFLLNLDPAETGQQGPT